MPSPRSGRRPLAAVVLALCLTATLFHGPASADEPRRQVTVNEAVAQVERRYGGRVVKVRTVRTERGLMYRIRVLARDGRVHTVTIPAER